MFKLSRETKIGILAIAAAALGIWGYKFLRGMNVLSTNQTFYVQYKNVDQLRPSSPIMINGFQVGMVKDLYIDPKDGRTIVAVLNVDGDVALPKNTVAKIVGVGLMGGRSIELLYTSPCKEGDCAESGDYLLGTQESFVETLLGDPKQLDQYTNRLRVGLTAMYDSLVDPHDPQGFGRTLLALERSLRNTAELTNKINKLLDASTSSFASTAENTAEITRAIRNNNQSIEQSLTNLAEVSNQLKAARFDQTSQKAATAIDSIGVALTTLRQALATAEHTIASFDTLASSINRGQGFVGQLATDQELYTNLVRTSRHLHLLLQDLRLNPRRYNSVKLRIFGGRKVKEYTLPTEDPAYFMLLDSIERAYSRKVDSVQVIRQ